MNSSIIRNVRRALAIAVALSVFVSCGQGFSVKKEIIQDDRYQILVVDSGSARLSKVDNDLLVTLNVFLPLSYQASQKQYPVIYFLPGYGEGPGQMRDRFKTAFDEAVAANGGREFIVVGVTGMNSLGGTFYVNSPVTGNWEDFTVKEAVALVESRYRVIPGRQARGLFGFSMGGFGAFNLGLRHPDVYGAVYALAPGLFDADGLKNAMPTWAYGDFKAAYGAAFAPDTGKPAPYADIPLFDGTEADNLVVSRWENGFGNIAKKVADCKALGKELGALFIAYSPEDGYPWIPRGCVYALDLLRQNGIPCGTATYAGGHAITREALSKSVIPFFYEHLAFSPAAAP
jgi:pimeloyl-ACP methyl ester carboxylesterase